MAPKITLEGVLKGTGILQWMVKMYAYIKLVKLLNL